MTDRTAALSRIIGVEEHFEAATRSPRGHDRLSRRIRRVADGTVRTPTEPSQ
jgi:hypothetical protein